MLGSIISGIAGLAGGLFNAKKQEEFAKNSITWKAQDAERAGISKIFAMGAPTHSFSPVSTGDFSNFGNELDKKMGTGSTGSTTTNKVVGINSEIQRAQLDGLRIDNDIKRAELASKINIATQPGAGHLLDRDVKTGPDGVSFERKIEPAGSSPNKSFGVSPEVSMYRTKDGYAPQIPQQLQEAFESDALSRWQWNARNKILPYISMDKYGTAPYPLEKNDTGYWTYSPAFGEYIYVPRGGSKTGPVPHKWEYLMDRLRR